jgi:hypothetical protein
MAMLEALFGLLLSPWQARADDRSTDWSTPADDQCVPDCRDGYECRRGECTPICNPVCGPGLLCTAGGECVRVESSAPPTPAYRASRGDGCFPTCRVGYTCLEGACVSMCNPVCPRGEQCTANGECIPERGLTSRVASSSEPEQPSVERARDSVVNVHVDVLSGLQFGLAPTVEVGTRFSGYARMRVLNTGLASYFVLGRDREDDFQWGLGGALGMHVFSRHARNMCGFYGGPALEYVWMQTRDVKRDFATYRTQLLVPQVDFGYRWRFGNFLLGLGARIGLAIPLTDHADPLGSEGCRRRVSCRSDLDVHFVPGLSLDLGYYFRRRED